MTQENVPIRYRLDADDRIISVEGPWDAFAQANDSPGAMAELCLDRVLWDFVEGYETQGYLNAVFFWSRRRSGLFESNYRCDSPDLRRLMRMRVSPLEGTDGGLEVESMLLRSEPVGHRPRVALLGDYRCDSRCSICLRFRIGDSWHDGLLQPDPGDFPPPYVVCPECRAAAEHSVHAAEAGGAPIPFRRAATRRKLGL